ncbi:hypothetical protein H257_09191 [Aphanomyces astaci]|uniref:Uncharacterized protein n=1 Tax=Aphanomyces astaci TaxID=112090 RepID=W4GAM8_APHAT|nr:hypothetical protein H257_09191 [Aphanomyces astaci]ETV76720.1 hypothetical protein H257_09191 [Aphanomyces astaci]|eukprot:XP_009833632.1 hypothetical protein H257_09191 [Aphanomyces astaci]
MGSTALRNESSGKTLTSTRLEPEEVAVVAAIFQLCGCSQIRLMIFYERGQAATASPLEVVALHMTIKHGAKPSQRRFAPCSMLQAPLNTPAAPLLAVLSNNLWCSLHAR